VRQHRLADDVADREDVRRVGAHLLVGRNEAALDHQDTRVPGADQPAIGPAADRHQNAIEAVGRRRPTAIEVDDGQNAPDLGAHHQP
jgi:hypothetical protein